MERLISVRIMNYVEANSILSDNQLGFRGGRNCEQMLSKFFHVLSSSLDERNCCLIDGIFLDFSSAFDKVDHNLLLSKLHSLGICGCLLQWIQNFLFMRQQRVIFKGAISDWCMVTSGVPQGSVLGPILFLLFVNDLNDVVSSPLFQFADDHTLVRPIYNVSDHEILQQDIHNIFEWCNLNKLPLNLSKCSVMHMTRCKSPSHCNSYCLGDAKLGEVDEFKLLGVTFSRNLSFDTHINNTAAKISKLSGFITRCTKNMSSSSLQKLYQALIMPHILYCACVWAPSQQKHLDRLEKVQRKITRTLFYKISPMADDRPSYSQRLKDFQLVKVEHLFRIQRLVFGYKIMNDFSPASFSSLIHRSKLDDSRLLHQLAKSSAFYNSMFISLPRLWNEIPSNVQKAHNLHSFKVGCKLFYMNLN